MSLSCRKLCLAFPPLIFAVLPACAPLENSKRRPIPQDVIISPSTQTEFAVTALAPGQRVARIPQTTPPTVTQKNEIPGVSGESPQPGALPSQIAQAEKPRTPIKNPADPSISPTVPPPVPIQPASISDPPLVAAIRAYIEKRPDQAIQNLSSLDKASQDLLLELIPMVVQASQIDMSRAGPHDIGIMISRLESISASLTTRAPLFITKACFCKSWTGFARYEAIPEMMPFQPGALADLYVEIKNVPSEPVITQTEGEGYQTKLDFTFRLQNELGDPVELTDRNHRTVQMLRESKRDFTHSPQRDYYILYKFPVPRVAGKYMATIEVLDPASGRAVSKTLMFRVR